MPLEKNYTFAKIDNNVAMGYIFFLLNNGKKIMCGLLMMIIHFSHLLSLY